MVMIMVLIMSNIYNNRCQCILIYFISYFDATSIDARPIVCGGTPDGKDECSGGSPDILLVEAYNPHN